MTISTWKDGSIDISEFSGENGVVLALGTLTTTDPITAYGLPVDCGDVDGDGKEDRVSTSYYLRHVYSSVSVEFMPGFWMDQLVITYYEEGSVAINLGSMIVNVTANLTNENIGQYLWFGDYNNDGYADVGLFGNSAIYVLFGDTLNQTEGDEFGNVLSGGAGEDTLNGYDGDDTLRGGGWADALNGGAGDDILNGGDGDDTMVGSTGDDTYIVRDAGDLVVELADEGQDTVRTDLASYTLPDNVEFLLLATGGVSGTGNALNNEVHGNAAANTLDGAGGDDTLLGFAGKDSLIGGEGADQLSGGSGSDTLDGGAGDDTLYGGLGVDRLTGGTGADTYMFTSSDLTSGRSFDIITDFSQSDGDTIDFSAFDADLTTSGQQGFTFIGTDYFTGHAGELRYVYDAANDYTYLRGDLDGDGRADLAIRLEGHIDLTSSDFNLFVPS